MAKRDKEETKKGMEAIFASPGIDLVSAVIAGDRARTGREAKNENKAENYDNKTSHNVIKQADNMTSHKVSRQTDRQTTSASRKPHKAPVSRSSSRGSELDTLSSRVVEAEKLAESPTMTVTLRIPQGMNDWLDEYVHEAWRQKIKKQDLVIEALRLVIARRGRAGDEIIPTELLPDDSK